MFWSIYQNDIFSIVCWPGKISKTREAKIQSYNFQEFVEIQNFKYFILRLFVIQWKPLNVITDNVIIWLM